MAFVKLCKLEDLWEGEMESFEVDGVEILVVWPTDGEIVAFQAVCPHQDIPLVEGKFDGKSLICRAHLWQFVLTSGHSIARPARASTRPIAALPNIPSRSRGTRCWWIPRASRPCLRIPSTKRRSSSPPLRTSTAADNRQVSI